MKKHAIPIIFSVSILLLMIPIYQPLATYLHPLVIPVVFFCVYVVVFSIALFFRKETVTFSVKTLSTGLGIYTLSLLVLLFFRPNEQDYGAAHNVNLVPFSTISLFLSGNADPLVAFYNIAANIVLFVPFGIALKWKRRNWFLLLIAPVLAISLIELTQHLTNRGSLDIDDLLLNTLGFFIGYLLTPVFKRIIKISS
ncbi:VanZ family protein [Bacillus tianshenii]|uniref:VanZ family protein n=1 Tax=Sutcliffiella tianshenii TaxID=1463404 RepID=UPI001CD65F1D|nr:VanZ family protein [Bacillus tianshenii]MCA1320367.1 VanZ family protein [Bacillus tianshenii]